MLSNFHIYKHLIIGLPDVPLPQLPHELALLQVHCRTQLTNREDKGKIIFLTNILASYRVQINPWGSLPWKLRFIFCFETSIGKLSDPSGLRIIFWSRQSWKANLQYSFLMHCYLPTLITWPLFFPLPYYISFWVHFK